MSAGCARLEVEPEQALLRDRKSHVSRSFPADEKIAGQIGALTQQKHAATGAEHDFVRYRRHGQPPVPGATVAMERSGGDTHGGERALHVAHAEAIEAPFAARQAHDRNAPGTL